MTHDELRDKLLNNNVAITLENNAVINATLQDSVTSADGVPLNKLLEITDQSFILAWDLDNSMWITINMNTVINAETF